MRFFVLHCLLCSAFSLCAQFQSAPIVGAQQVALAFTGLCNNANFGQASNPATLPLAESPNVYIHAQQPFLLPELHQVAIGGMLPTNSGTFSIQLQQMGIPGFRQQSYQVSYGRTLFSSLTLGAAIRAIHTDLSEYGNAWSTGYTIGLTYNYSDKLRAGALLRQPIPTPNPKNLQIPASYQLGIHYVVSNLVDWYTEIEKNVHFPVRIKTAIEYRAVSALALRIGVLTNPAQITFGVGYRLYEKIQLDLATAYHQQLGWSPACSIGYSFN